MSSLARIARSNGQTANTTSSSAQHQIEMRRRETEQRRKEYSEIPSDLKKLTKLITQAIYKERPEMIILINLLLHWFCLEESDIVKLSGLGKKLVTATLNNLEEKDRFIKHKEMFKPVPSEIPGEKDKKTKISFYYINYNAIVNILVYKKYRMMQKAENEAKTNASRATYKCSQEGCEKTFTELDMALIYNPMLDKLLCDFCQSDVKEDEIKNREDLRSLPTTLNDRMKEIDRIIEERMKFISLAPELTDPSVPDNNIPDKYEDIKNYSKNKNRLPELLKRNHDGLGKGPLFGSNSGRGGPGNNNNNANGQNLPNWKTGPNIGIPLDSDITVEIISNAEIKRMRMDKSNNKDVPIWMRQSTVKGADQDTISSKLTKKEEEQSLEEKKRLFSKFLDDPFEIKDDELIDDLEDYEDENDNASSGNKKKTSRVTGRGRWWMKRADEVVQTLRTHEKINDEDNDNDYDDNYYDDEMNNDNDSSDDDNNNNNHKTHGSSSSKFCWPRIIDIGSETYRYDQLLKNPEIVENFTEQQKIEYKNRADQHFDISFMF